MVRTGYTAGRFDSSKGDVSGRLRGGAREEPEIFVGEGI